jgi:hypothetical protein
MTTTAPVPELHAAPPVVRKLIDWFETTHLPDGLFTDDVFLDFTSPQWRQQAQGIDGVRAIRDYGHPGPGRVPRLRYDPTPTGFVLEWAEQWDDAAGHWYCREMLRAEVRDGSIAEVSVYCTGDWNEALVARHAREAHLIRP